MKPSTRRNRARKMGPDSFGAFFEELMGGGPRADTADTLLDLYPTLSDQTTLCYRMLRSRGDDWNPFDPWGSHDSECMWADMEAMKRRCDEEDAWDQHDFPEGLDFHRYCGGPCLGDFEDAMEEVDEYLDSLQQTPANWPESWVREWELWDRIVDAIDCDGWKSSKKRWGRDRTARNVRRDGSPRDKVGRNVNKAYNESLRREERRQSRQNLIDIAFGVIDADDVAAPIRGTLPFWDKGTPPQTKQA